MTREEAIRRIKAWNLDSDDREVLAVIIPELAESEDERIRRELKEAFEAYDIESSWNGIPIRSIFAWLEKQKEQKDYHKLYEDIAQSEWFKKAYVGKSLGEEQKPIAPCDASWYAYYRRGYQRGLEVGRKEQKPVEWSEEDEAFLKVAIAICNRYSHKDIADWLKSLRPSWKPSEEHLSALLAVFNDPNNIGSQTCQLALTDLYEQLNKL